MKLTPYFSTSMAVLAGLSMICLLTTTFTTANAQSLRSFTEGPGNDAPAPFVQGLTTGVQPESLELLEGQHYQDGQPAAWDVDSYALAQSDTTGIIRMIYDFPETYWPAIEYAFLCAWDTNWPDLECSYRSNNEPRPVLTIPVMPESEVFVSTALGFHGNPDNTVLIMEDPLRLVSQRETFGIDAGRTGDYTIERTGDFVGFPVLEEVPAFDQPFVQGSGVQMCVDDAIDAMETIDQVDAYTTYQVHLEEAEDRQTIIRLPLTDNNGTRLDLEALGFQLRGNVSNVLYVFSGSGEQLYGDGLDEQDPSFDEFYEEGEFNAYLGDMMPILPVGHLAQFDLSDEDYLVIMFGNVIRTSTSNHGCLLTGRGTWPIKHGQVYLMPIYPQAPTINLDLPRVRTTNQGLELGLDIGARNQISYVAVTATNGSDYTSTDSIRVDWRANSTESYTALLESAPVGQQLEVSLQPLGRTMYFEHQPIGEPTTFTINVPVDSEGGATTPRDFTVSQVWPNPARENARVSITTPQPGSIIYQVIDLLGRTVIQDETRITGTVELDLDVSGLKSGVYFLRVQSSIVNDVKTKRLTVIN